MTSGKTGIFDRRLLTLLASSFVFKVILVHIFPAFYGADPVGRLLHRNELFFSYWLPGLQAVILAVSRATDDLLVLRYVLIFISTIAGLTLYNVVRRIADKDVSLYSTAFFVFSPLSVFLSLVPYQEMLFAAFALTSLYFFFSKESPRSLLAASLFLGAACLTRYEGWLLAGVLSIAYVRDKRKAKQQSESLVTYLFEIMVTGGKAVLLFGWAPIALFMLGLYTSPENNAALIDLTSIQTVPRYILFVITKSILWSNPILVALILAAALQQRGFVFFRGRVNNANATKTLTAFAALFMALLLLFVSDATRYNQRFMFVPSIVVCILAGFSVSSLQATTAIPSVYARILSICIIGALLVVPTGAILRATQTPDVRIPFEIAVYMNSHLQQSDRALVLAKLWEGSPDAVPNEYTRIATQTRSGSERILPPNEFRYVTNPDSIIRARDIRYLIEFSHFEEQGYLKEFKEYILNSTGMVREVASWDHVRVLEVISGESR